MVDGIVVLAVKRYGDMWIKEDTNYSWGQYLFVNRGVTECYNCTSHAALSCNWKKNSRVFFNVAQW